VLGTVVSIFVAAGAAAAIETDTVNSYARGLWWSISLITTTGFIGQPPRTEAGAGLSVILMVLGFVLLAMVSAALAALFVRDDEGPRGGREDAELKEISRYFVRCRRGLAQWRHRCPTPSRPRIRVMLLATTTERPALCGCAIEACHLTRGASGTNDEAGAE
jgi:hypothetical protein